MKRSTVIWLIIAAALVIIGGIIFCIVMIRGKWNFTSLDTENYITRTVDIDKSFENISFETDVDEIAFAPSEDGKCRVEFYEIEDRPHTADVSEGTLCIASDKTGGWHISFTISSPKITLYLPLKEYGSLMINEDTGNIYIPHDFAFDSIDITASTGNVGCFASAADKIRIILSTGNISIDGVSAKDAELQVSTGAIIVSNAAVSNMFSTSVTTGRSEYTNVTCRGFTSTGSTGRINLNNVIVSETLSVERSTGDVIFDGCDAAEINVKTDTGDVMGTLLSEKVFLTSSDTGDIDVPKTTSGGTCEIITDTGDISIEISRQ